MSQRYEVEVFDGLESVALCIRHCGSDSEATDALLMEADEWKQDHRLVLRGPGSINLGEKWGTR